MQDINDTYCSKDDLPDWVIYMFDHERKKELRRRYKVIKTRGNGDCLFHSIHLILISIMGRGAYTSHQLRKMIASTILDIDNKKIISLLEEWRNILLPIISPPQQKEKDTFKDILIKQSLLHEYRYALPLLQDKSPFSISTRRQIYENMMNPNIFWGEEFSLYTLEVMLDTKFFVLRKELVGGYPVAKLQTGYSHSSNFKPRYFGILLLENDHYVVISKLINKRGKDCFITSFGQQDIPQFVTCHQ